MVEVSGLGWGAVAGCTCTGTGRKAEQHQSLPGSQDWQTLLPDPACSAWQRSAGRGGPCPSCFTGVGAHRHSAMSTASLERSGASAELRPLTTSVIHLVWVAVQPQSPAWKCLGWQRPGPSLLGCFKSPWVAALSSFITWAALSQLLGKPHHQRDIISFD